ncbi:MAG: phytanoyl-CoA dioxygenase family protein [Acidimicrobiia bacterium]|nr:phytanoyl-CoA dioxygenase family protein [Acidimicrobiia bacterium]
MRAHPWNTDFTWTSAEADAPSFLSPAQVEQFDRDGFVVVPDIIDAETLAELRAELDTDEARADELLRQMPDQRLSIAESGAITFSPHVVKRSGVARRFAHHPALVGIVGDLVGPDARLYWDQLVYKKPDKPREFPWHQDNGYTYVEPQQYLTCWVPLIDATIANGCPWVVPGAHRHGTLHHEWNEPLGFECIDEPVDAVAVEVAAGGVAVFSSLTPHKTGPNTTDSVRKTYILQYAPDGSVVCSGDPAAGPPSERVAADAPDRQFVVLVGGQPVTHE